MQGGGCPGGAGGGESERAGSCWCRCARVCVAGVRWAQGRCWGRVGGLHGGARVCVKGSARVCVGLCVCKLRVQAACVCTELCVCLQRAVYASSVCMCGAACVQAACVCTELCVQAACVCASSVCIHRAVCVQAACVHAACVQAAFVCRELCVCKQHACACSGLALHWCACKVCVCRTWAHVCQGPAVRVRSLVCVRRVQGCERAWAQGHGCVHAAGGCRGGLEGGLHSPTQPTGVPAGRWPLAHFQGAFGVAGGTHAADPQPQGLGQSPHTLGAPGSPRCRHSAGVRMRPAAPGCLRSGGTGGADLWLLFSSPA